MNPNRAAQAALCASRSDQELAALVDALQAEPVDFEAVLLQSWHLARCDKSTPLQRLMGRLALQGLTRVMLARERKREGERE